MKQCEDGFVRLTLDALMSIPLKHLISGMDDDGSAPVDACGRAASVSGYTEWLSDTALSVVLGWDWVVDLAQGVPLWQRSGTPRSNIMLVDSRNDDLGWHKNLQALGTIVDAMNWQHQTQEAISRRYA